MQNKDHFFLKKMCVCGVMLKGWTAKRKSEDEKQRGKEKV